MYVAPPPKRTDPISGSTNGSDALLIYQTWKGSNLVRGISMAAQEASKKTSLPQLVKFGKAFKLAEQWVDNMSKLEEDDKSRKVKLDSRPVRLGIGAAVPRETRVSHSNDPVERKLRAKLDSNKRKVVKNAEVSAISAKDGDSHQDSDDDELDSRTRAFAKKRPPEKCGSQIVPKSCTQWSRDHSTYAWPNMHDMICTNGISQFSFSLLNGSTFGFSNHLASSVELDIGLYE